MNGCLWSLIAGLIISAVTFLPLEGFSQARKIAMCCEFFNVRTSWHGPPNVSPIGHTVNMHLDLATYNFGIGEGEPFSDELKELFPGAPERKNGYTYCNDLPGLGIDITKNWLRNTHLKVAKIEEFDVQMVLPVSPK